MTAEPQSPTKAAWKGKGKGKANEHDFADLNPTITYRHILSQNLGVKDPLRVVALCDSDAFYAACEMVRLGVDKETPLVVLQWDSLIAVNYPARKFGISRMDKKKDALKRCPHLKVVHVATYKEGEKEPGYWEDVDTNTHKVSLDYYRRESVKIAALFREMLPGCEVEKASIDEAFIDFTKPVREILLQRYPYLASVPPDAPYGVDSPLPPPPPISWEGKGTVIPIHPPPTPAPQEVSPEGTNEGMQNASSSKTTEDEVEREETNVEEVSGDEDENTTWHDVALSIASDLMGRAREAVLTQLGYSTSAGLARNKFLAKLTASYRKPNGQSILRNAAIPNYLIPMPFQKIRFLGGKLGKAMAQEYDASTVGDLLTIDLGEMQDRFGEDSVWVYEILRGIDRSEVKDKGTAWTKSMLASKNLPKPITNASEGYHWIRVLAAELALRLNDARTHSPNLWPKSIILHARKGYESGRSKQAPFPYTREVTVDAIAAAGDRLWKELVGPATTMKVSSVQLAFGGIDVAETGQQSIEGFLKAKPPSKRPRDESDELGDGIEDQPGELDKSGEPSGNEGNRNGSDIEDPNSSRTAALTYNCSRCGKTLYLKQNAQAFAGDDEQETALAALKLEHDDWHFAQDLVRQDSTVSGGKRLVPVPQKIDGGKTKKRRKETVGIEKFFSKK